MCEYIYKEEDNHMTHQNKEERVELKDMLAARERRALTQKELLGRYHLPLISFTMNIAGPVKNSGLIRRGFAHGHQLIHEQLMRIKKGVVAEFLFDAPTGSEGYYVLDMDPLFIKRMTCELEDTDSIGRLFDMDVIGTDGMKLDRGLIGQSGRQCLICGKPAAECARNRTHTVEELKERTDAMLLAFIRDHDAELIARNALRALLYEVSTTPKPGLVDRINNGSHKDMDFFTFLDSSAALAPYFKKCALIGMDTRDEDGPSVFGKIRIAGAKAERAMVRATNGVNTHKGAIFSVGIVACALGRLDPSKWKDASAVLTSSAEIVAGITERDFRDLTEETARTVGQKLYLQYGIRGVRGQAEDGFPAVLEAGYPALKKALAGGAHINRAGSISLLAILAGSTDTNLIARGSREIQLEVRKKTEELLRGETAPSEDRIREMDEDFMKRNLSPGGSADLLGVSYLLHFMSEETVLPKELVSSYEEEKDV